MHISCFVAQTSFMFLLLFLLQKFCCLGFSILLCSYFFPPDVLGFVTGYYLNRQKMMVQSFYFFFLLLPLCAMFYFTFALSVCGFEVTVLDVRRSVAVLFLFLYFSFLFLEVFELYSINISLTVSCSSCFINTSKYDQHTPVFVSSLSELFPRPST